MGIYADLQAKIIADREAGRDVPLVIEELAMLIAGVIDPQTKPETASAPPPVSNDHIAEGATPFTAAEILASTPQSAEPVSSENTVPIADSSIHDAPNEPAAEAAAPAESPAPEQPAEPIQTEQSSSNI